MKKGSIYVGLVLATLAGYFVYQTWFNPSRVVKRRLGEIAGALSVPESEPDLGRLTRLARLRSYLADDVQLTAGSYAFNSRDAVVGALAAARAPKGGADIQFVDVQVAVDSDSAAHAGLMLEVNTRDQQTGEWLADQYETIVNLEKRGGEWVVVRGAIKDRRPR
jgi:hypothetical protein